MSKALKTTFLIHAVVGLLFGAPLLIIPGRVLQWLGWAPIDPIISRVLGAALLALAWSSFRGWQAAERAQVALLLEMEAAFTVLGCIGLLRHLLSSSYPAMPWISFVILAIFAVAWIVFLFKK
jgi:Co/Zn/Cd efflux system component